MQEVAGESWWGRYGRKWRKAVETWERMEQRNRNPPKVTFLAQGLLSSFLTAEYVRFWPWTWGASTEMQGEHEELGSRKIVPRCASTKKHQDVSNIMRALTMKRCPPQTMCAFHFLNKSNLVSKYLPDAKAHVLCAFGVHGDEGWTLVGYTL